MKAIYVYSRIEEDTESSGEAKKAIMQVKALNENGVDTKLMYHNRYIYGNKILVRLPFYRIYSRRFVTFLLKELKNIDAVYIRKYIIDRSFLYLLERIRKEKKHIKIILEIPTYPYDLEWKSLIDSPLLRKDMKNRKKIKGYIDRIVTFSNDDIIFSVPTIKTSNGIDVNTIKCRKSNCHCNKKIHLLGVATLERWHGYDRVIKGLEKYYSKKYEYEILFHIVGDGAELENLKKICRSCNMQKYVFFHGRMNGEKLDEMFDKCDIGVGSLGMHRIGLKEGYTLKLREYMARGIPFIYGYADRLIENCGCRYTYKYPNNDNSIDLNKLVIFYKSFEKTDPLEIACEMSAHASKELSWNCQMKPIADYIKNEYI